MSPWGNVSYFYPVCAYSCACIYTKFPAPSSPSFVLPSYPIPFSLLPFSPTFFLFNYPPLYLPSSFSSFLYLPPSPLSLPASLPSSLPPLLPPLPPLCDSLRLPFPLSCLAPSLLSSLPSSLPPFPSSFLTPSPTPSLHPSFLSPLPPPFHHSLPSSPSPPPPQVSPSTCQTTMTHTWLPGCSKCS